MAYDFSSFDVRSTEVVAWLQKEFATIRTGRATPTILDGVQVDSYGARVPVAQLGTVGTEDPRTLRVSIWDASQVKAVEKAIIDANLGLSVMSDEKGVRVIFPELTGERREQLMKQAKGKLEEARVSLRSARDDAMKKLEAADLSDDETFTVKEDLQKKVDAKNAELADLLMRKESEITQ
ncbi:ribosome recycling factor [Candidatus Parcubacteria bacterium]|uniref:Ribosome recycling factor n=1 Tax=Candidatus Kaiserbacteria bacterium CG10_big_fil_rev_8_21_14_0_10_47_16 TaxID=1974608 RepID=A0A2H0UD66_9BACT|nr:ribosome recycling factor [Candidatus Parcubacteria bacterium]PIR84368.1 MAG: ribosome recycling factor [Candidatus Kaiserbacteria bacterium CG10_big_fil_rev_8_21_14_0_10_47_16]